MKKMAAAVFLATLGLSFECSAACAVVKKGNGVLVDVPVACESLETPMPCSKVTVLASGSTLIEDVPCAPGQQKTVEQIQREEAAEQKRKCGRDYQAVRVGMSVARFESCTDGLAYATETVIKGAVIETYRSTFYWIQAKDGRIVAFTRR